MKHIPKGYIVKVGDFNNEGRAVDWIIDCGDLPNSTGYYIPSDDPETHIIGGYTLKELREIKASYENMSERSYLWSL